MGFSYLSRKKALSNDMRTGRGDASRVFMKELIILEGIGMHGRDELMVVSGERIETQADPNFYPFTHAVTFRLCHSDAVRVGQKIITISETAILEDSQLPKATQLPAVETSTTTQLTLFGNDDTEAQLSLF